VIHVFAGPTLTGADRRRSTAGMRVLGPARHGDLFDPAIGDGDTVVLLDGLYHHTPALRHKEILHALDRGIAVIGAASIGALRAAELAGTGMVGVGRIHHAYASGAIDGDDEVAVVHAPDGDYAASTWPLVNLRHVLALAVRDQVAGSETAFTVLEELRGIHYPHRTLAAVRSVARRCGAADFACWLTGCLAAAPGFGDLKRDDALLALRTARDLDRTPAPRPAAAGDAAGQRRWDTVYFRRWSDALADAVVDGVRLPTAARLAYQQLFDPDFPDVWRAWSAARTPPPVAAVLGDDPGALHALFPRRPDLRDRTHTDVLLAGESAQDRAALARYLDRNRTAAARTPGFAVEAIPAAAALQVLAPLWRTDEPGVEARAWERGVAGTGAAVDAVRLFLLGLAEDRRTACARTGEDR
jgi:hypothetical protein